MATLALLYDENGQKERLDLMDASLLSANMRAIIRCALETCSFNCYVVGGHFLTIASAVVGSS
jgi:hypothetical protein